MKKAKEGVALILTISVLSALSILGITFMMLLTRDQALMNEQVKSWNNDSAVNSAIRAGIEEIKKQTEIYSAYFCSTIQTAYEAKKDSDFNDWDTKFDFPETERIKKSSFLGRIWDFDNKGDDIPYKDDAKPGYIYFKNTIRASNAKLSLYQGGPEFRNLMISLGDVLKVDNTSTNIDRQCRRIADTLLLYHTNWVVEDVDEILKMPIKIGGVADAKQKAEVADLLKPYLTTTPVYKPDELSVNIIDYGVCDTASGTTFRAVDRDFLPPNNDINALTGAIITIISGAGEGQSNIIDTVDNTDDHVLNLKNNWTTNPNSTSKYRIHSLVSPINLNAADRELIIANLQIPIDSFQPSLSDFLGSWIKLPMSGFPINLNPNTSNLGQIIGSLQGIRKPSIHKTYKDFKDWRSKDIDSSEQGIIPKSPLNEELLEKNKFLKLFMLDYPKALIGPDSDGDYEIPVLPVPFTFEHNGYFDMEISTALKNNPNSKVPLNNIKRYSTVRLEGKKELSLREHFENDQAKLNWMTTNDFVPVQSIVDFSDWYMKGSSYDSKAFHPYNWIDNNPTKAVETEKFPNVLPDSIKTGLWFDFGGEGKFYDQEETGSNKWKDMDKLNELFEKKIGDDMTTGGECKSNYTVPDTPPSSSYQLGTDGNNKYVFGDVCVVIRMIDSAVNIYHPISPTFYDLATGNTIHDHYISDHKDPLPVGLKYPPKKYFTPTLELWSESIGATFRVEKGYDSTVYTAADNPSPNCHIPNDPHTFAVSASKIKASAEITDSDEDAFRANTYQKSPLKNVWWNESLFYGIIARNPESASHYFVKSAVTDETNIDEGDDNVMPYTDSVMLFNTKKLSDSDDSMPSPFGTLTSSDMRGHIKIKRDWDTDYYYKTNAAGTQQFDGKFNIDFLRIIPGPRDDSGIDTYPYYESAPINLKNAKYLKKIRVWYDVSNHSSFVSEPDDKFSFYFKVNIKRPKKIAEGNDEWKEYGGITNNEEIRIQNIDSQEMSKYYSNNDHEAYQDLTIDPSDLYQDLMVANKNDVDYDQDVEIKIEICYKNLSNKDELTFYLRNTIAITRIELFYEAEPTIIRCSENP